MIETRKLTIDEWRRLAEAGVLPEDERLEFRYGEIIKMTPIGKEYLSATNLLNGELTVALYRQATVSPQNPLDLGELEVYPDFALLKPGRYRERLPSRATSSGLSRCR